ncbi:hypothetical protein WR25_03474 isoform A [Diploscapter pachys]|uniref:mitogen-activated protein kinase kinase kinase n=1 Tax=Diploscapter pachys TaxID=2018661 RepID=A0A2A2LAP4_9BILA|nr:hypothetical protein WR25_03474 isoform A [Diploscapter pachys]
MANRLHQQPMQQENQPEYVNLPCQLQHPYEYINSSHSHQSSQSNSSHGYPSSAMNSGHHATVGDTCVQFREGYDSQISHTSRDTYNSSEIFLVLYDYSSDRDDELVIKTGDEIQVITKNTGEDGWYYGRLSGREGLFPENYGKLLGDENKITVISGEKLQHAFTNIEHGRIGTGATADVFRIQYEKQWVALKKFKDSLNKGFLRREAICLAQLSHVSIVKFLGMCLDPGKIGLVLELCEGGSLRSVYKANKQRVSEKDAMSIQKANDVEAVPIPMKTLIKWATQVARGMQYLCSQGFIHRDLKAENVLVKEKVCNCKNPVFSDGVCRVCKGSSFDNFTLKITDFGATKTTDAIKKDLDRCSQAGTYAWLAPEAFRDQDYSEASDVWSFGVVMWELLVQEDPFQGMVPITIALGISKGDLCYEIKNDCPKRWREIMSSCWQAEKEQRPNFSMLVSQLEEYEQSEPDEKDESELKRMQSLCNRDYRSIYERYSPTQKKELDSIYVSLYEKNSYGDSSGESTVDGADSAPVEWKWRRLFAWKKAAPKTETRSKNNKKQITSSDIGPPTDPKHIHSARVANICPIPRNDFPSTPNGSHLDNLSNLQCFRYDDSGAAQLTPATPEVFGTLPRPEKLITTGRPSVINASFSRSSPNLNALSVDDAAPTLRRKDAIRKKSRPSIDTTQGGGGAWTPTTEITTPVNNSGTPTLEFARIDDAEEDTISDKGTTGRSKGKHFWDKFASKKNRSSRESEDADDANLVGFSSSTTNHRISHKSPSIIPFGQLTKSPGGAQFLVDKSVRRRADSAASENSASSTPSLGHRSAVANQHRVSPAERAQPRTTRAMTHAADMLVPLKSTLDSPVQEGRPSGLPKSSPIGLDQPYPPSPSNNDDQEMSCIPYKYLSSPTNENGSSRNHNQGYDNFSPETSGTRGRNASGLQHMNTRNPGHHHVPSLSEVVPIPNRCASFEEPTHYDMHNGEVRIPPTHHARMAHQQAYGDTEYQV